LCPWAFRRTGLRQSRVRTARGCLRRGCPAGCSLIVGHTVRRPGRVRRHWAAASSHNSRRRSNRLMLPVADRRSLWLLTNLVAVHRGSLVPTGLVRCGCVRRWMVRRRVRGSVRASDVSLGSRRVALIRIAVAVGMPRLLARVTVSGCLRRARRMTGGCLTIFGRRRGRIVSACGRMLGSRRRLFTNGGRRVLTTNRRCWIANRRRLAGGWLREVRRVNRIRPRRLRGRPVDSPRSRLRRTY
jgi:hypothetical protein